MKTSIPLAENEPLPKKTTWGIGGRARYFSRPRDEDELSSLLRDAERSSIPVYVLGNGSNLLITDGLLDGLVLQLDPAGAMAGIQMQDLQYGRIKVGAATLLPTLVQETAALGLSGMEDLVGIPGTVGAAVCLNAGNPARGIGSMVESAEAIDRAGRKFHLERNQMHFAYRWSNLSDLVITAVTFILQPGDTGKIRSEMQKFLLVKQQNQPLDRMSAGCVFKNPRNRPAAQLIDELGLKGFTAGNAQVSTKHANFIINRGNATCDDVLRVIGHVRRRVSEVFDEELKLEIKLWT